MAAPSRRAEPPRIPPHPPGLTEAEAEHHNRIRETESRERRGMVRGLILLALLVLVLSIARAGLDRVFLHAWWRP